MLTTLGGGEGVGGERTMKCAKYTSILGHPPPPPPGSFRPSEITLVHFYFTQL